MIWLRRLCLLALIAAASGCATTYQDPPSRQSQSPRARCLANPNETDMRPLIFLFCVENP